MSLGFKDWIRETSRSDITEENKRSKGEWKQKQMQCKLRYKEVDATKTEEKYDFLLCITCLYLGGGTSI